MSFTKKLYCALTALFLMQSGMQAQNVSGIVVDDQQKPVAGVVVAISGVSGSITTVSDGKFSINNLITKVIPLDYHRPVTTVKPIKAYDLLGKVMPDLKKVGAGVFIISGGRNTHPVVCMRGTTTYRLSKEEQCPGEKNVAVTTAASAISDTLRAGKPGYNPFERVIPRSEKMSVTVVMVKILMFDTVLTNLPGHTASLSTSYEFLQGRKMFEGDIVLETDGVMHLVDQTKTSNGLIVSTDAISVINGNTGPWPSKDSYLWPNGIVPYTIHPDINTSGLLYMAIMAAIAEYNAKTNVRMVPRLQDPGYIEFVEDTAMYSDGNSDVGRQGGKQRIMLNTTDTGTIIHELGHAIGLWHEMSRSDRDSYVRVLFENVEPGYEHNFSKHISDGMDIGPFDAGSIMMYSPIAFGVFDPITGWYKTTIESLVPGVTIGSRATFSQSDILGINHIYPPRNKPIYPVLYNRPLFCGDTLLLDISRPDLSHVNFDNAANSISVPAGYSVVLFDGTDYSGNQVVLQGPVEIADLASFLPARTVWNNGISSIRLIGKSGEPFFCQSTPTAFADGAFTGRTLDLTRDAVSLAARDFDNIITSLYVPAGWTFTGYEHPRFQGKSITLQGPISIKHLTTESPAPDHADWNDRIDSYTVTGPGANAEPASCGNGPVLFEHDNGYGRQLDCRESIVDIRGSYNFDDIGSSACVPAGHTLTFFEHTGFTGNSFTVVGPRYIRDLEQHIVNGICYNDKISSVRVDSPASTILPNRPTVYGLEYFGDPSWEMPRSVPDLRPWNIDDRIRSIKVPASWTVTLYENLNYTGRSLVLTGPASLETLSNKNGMNWNGIATSIAVTPPAGTTPFTACKSPCVFNDGYLTGKMTEIGQSIPDLRTVGANDCITSVCVPNGWRVILYENLNYTGRSQTIIGPQEVFLLTTMDDRATSIEAQQVN